MDDLLDDLGLSDADLLDADDGNDDAPYDLDAEDFIRNRLDDLGRFDSWD